MLSLLYCLWILRLFKPEWIVSFYIPSLQFLRILPTILQYAVLAWLVLLRSKDIRIDRPLAFFLLCVGLSAVFAENTGLGRQGLRTIGDNFVFFTLNLTILAHGDNSKALDRILKLYISSFVVFGIVGIANKGIVPFHIF